MAARPDLRQKLAATQARGTRGCLLILAALVAFAGVLALALRRS